MNDRKKTALVIAPDVLTTIKAAQRKFSTIAKRNGQLVNWPTEFNFAQQIIAKSKYLQQCVPQSITDSIINVAAIGLSLNPQRKHCALIPRWDTNLSLYVCNADPMYQGLISIATESDAIASTYAEVVREDDVHSGNFRYQGGTSPHVMFTPNPMMTPEQRGKIVGAFCVTHLRDSPIPQVTWMRIEDIYAIRDHYSEAYKNKLKKERENPGKHFYGGPWESADEEMIKKTLIKRASKTWPKRTARLDHAVHLSNEAEGARIEPRPDDIEGEAAEVELITKTQHDELEKLRVEAGVKIEKILNRFKIESLDKLPRSEYIRCEKLLKESKLVYLLRSATPDTVIYAADWGLTLEALEGKAANEYSKAKLLTKRDA